MAWTDDPLTTSIKIRKSHLDDILSRLNTERTERGYAAVDIEITAGQTKVMDSHISSIRDWLDSTPLTVGCSTHYGTVYSTRYSTVKNSYHFLYRSSNNSRVCTHNNTVYNTKAPCFIQLRRISWRGLMLP